MAQNNLQLNITTKADTKPLDKFRKDFAKAFGMKLPKAISQEMMEVAKRLQALGQYKTPIKALEKSLDLTKVLTGNKKALAAFIRSLDSAKTKGTPLQYARTDTEIRRRGASNTEVNKLIRSLSQAANAVKPLRMSLVKVDDDFRKIYVRTVLVKERLMDHKRQVSDLKAKVTDLRKQYDASAETAKTKREVNALGRLKLKLDAAEAELKTKVVRYQRDLNKATKEQAMLVDATNRKLQGQAVSIKSAADQEKKLSDNAKVVLNTARAQQTVQERLTREKKIQADIDRSRREAYALQIAGNQLRSYGDQWAAVGRQAAEAFGNIDYEVRRAASASGLSFEDTAEGVGAILRPAEQVTQQISLMNETAKRAAESLGFIATEEVARGMYFFASTTGEGFNSVNELNASMSQLTPIMQAAAITSSDLETTIKGVYGVINQFAMPMDNAASVTEMLYYAAQKTAAELPDFIESLKMLGPVAHQAGVGFEDTLKSLGVLADSGIRGTMAGRALRQMFLQLNDPSDRATKALDKAASRLKGTGTVFKDLVYDAQGNFMGMAHYIRQMAELTNTMTQREKTRLLGMIATAAETPALTKLIEAESEAMKRGTSIINDNSKGIGDAAKARELFAESVKLVSESTKASLGRIDIAIKNIKATFGEALAPALERLSFALVGISERFDKFANANPELVQMAATFAMLASSGAILAGASLGVISVFKMLTGVVKPTIKQMGVLRGILAATDETFAANATATRAAAGGMANAGKNAKAVGGILAGLRTKIASPFTNLAKAIPGASKALSGFGRIFGVIGAVAKIFSLKVQIVITALAGVFTGLFQALNGGKKDVDFLGGAMKALEPIFQVMGAALEAIGKAFGLIFELGRSLGILLGNLFGPEGDFYFFTQAFAGFAEFMTSAFGFLGDVIDNLTTGIQQMNDAALDPNKRKLSEIRSQIAALEAEQHGMYGTAGVDHSERIAQLKKEEEVILSQIKASEDQRSMLKKHADKIKEIDIALTQLRSTVDTTKGKEQKAAEERLRALELERGKLLAIIELTKIANAERTYFLGGNKDIYESRQRVLAGSLSNLNTSTSTSTDSNSTGSGQKMSARERALELAQQAASLAEALYKIEGINLKALIRKTMGEVAEAMKLAVKLAAPYAKAFSDKTLEKVGNFSSAVGGIASAVGGMVDAATKLAEYKSPKPAAIKRVITDMSIAMKAMVEEAKKFTGSQVAIVQMYADSATAVVGSIGAAVEAFNSMATGVYQPPANVLKQIAKDISRAVQEFTKQLASAPTQPMLDKAKAFAEAADAVLGTIGNAIGAFKDLRNYVKPLPSMLQGVVDTIEIAVRQMLVSMGRFSLNQSQWEVVKTFAEVANAIASAVGGTYDAFVKQMDFVDQFREEIDYDKVFSWIEMGIKKMADIAAAMPVGMIQMAKDAAEAAQAIAGALDAFFKLATETGGDPALLADSLQTAVNSVLAIIEAFASTTQFVGASFVDSLIAGMQSRESALAVEAARLNSILGTVGGSSVTRSNNNTLTINHVVTDPNGVLKNASAAEVAQLLSGDVFITNLQHTIKTQ